MADEEVLHAAEVPSLGRPIKDDKDFIHLNKALRACFVCRLVKTENQVRGQQAAAAAPLDSLPAPSRGRPQPHAPTPQPNRPAPPPPPVHRGRLRQLPLLADARRPGRRGQPDDAQLHRHDRGDHAEEQLGDAVERLGERRGRGALVWGGGVEEQEDCMRHLSRRPLAFHHPLTFTSCRRLFCLGFNRRQGRPWLLRPGHQRGRAHTAEGE